MPLNGLMNEIGVYSCRWNNSLGQPRYRNFTVLIGNASGSTHATAIPLSANLIALIVIIGIGVKIYLDKVTIIYVGLFKMVQITHLEMFKTRNGKCFQGPRNYWKGIDFIRILTVDHCQWRNRLMPYLTINDGNSPDTA